MNKEKLGWNINANDRMIIDVLYNGEKVMSLSLHEAIESSSRKKVLEHIRVCDATSWLTRWQQELGDAVAEKLKTAPK